MKTPARQVVHVGVASWIIQDGNYADFERDRSYRFALEFFPHRLRPSRRGAAVAHRLEHDVGGLYDARGTVVRVSEESWVVDLGVPVFQDAAPPSWAKPGVAVSGRIYVGIDPYFYFENLRHEPGMPNLFRRWRVRKIQLETTPWKASVGRRGEKLLARRKIRPTFKDVPRTDAWKHDHGRAHYILECELEERRVSRR
jgi:hypothetical protein